MVLAGPPESIIAAYGLGGGAWQVISPEGLNLSLAFVGRSGERLHLKQIRSPCSPSALAASLRRSQELDGRVFVKEGIDLPLLRR